MSIIGKFFSPAIALPVTEDKNTVARRYRRLRWSVFLSATMGYALFYVCRLSLSVLKKPLVDAQLFTESELGKIGSALFFSYAIGKLINGFFSDRMNVNRFISLGLLFTALCNLGMGAYPNFYAFILMWGLSGWFQSTGAAPCVVALTRWFNHKERGTYYGIWSASHNIGKAITFQLLPLLHGTGGLTWGVYFFTLLEVFSYFFFLQKLFRNFQRNFYPYVLKFRLFSFFCMTALKARIFLLQSRR